ncbi:MAG: hypothetical protein KME18_16730 [Phormidium tanganyikae FI6-MK23]|jgi:hypothetical protein|nr:hypothetical protein [Phormidium tanganyikae FI6-MK23]
MKFDSIEALYLSNGAIVILPKGKDPGRVCQQLPQIIRSVQRSNPAARKCDRIFLLVNGEYIEMQIAFILNFVT